MPPIIQVAAARNFAQREFRFFEVYFRAMRSALVRNIISLRESTLGWLELVLPDQTCPLENNLEKSIFLLEGSLKPVIFWIGQGDEEAEITAGRLFLQHFVFNHINSTHPRL